MGARLSPVIGLILFGTCFVFADDTQTDSKALQGKWVAVMAEEMGDKASDHELKRKPTILEITDKKLVISFGKDDRREFSMELDASTDPKHIDLHHAEPNSVTHGIYKLEDGIFTLCVEHHLHPNGKEDRPVEFRTDKNSKNAGLKLLRIDFVKKS